MWKSTIPISFSPKLQFLRTKSDRGLNEGLRGALQVWGGERTDWGRFDPVRLGQFLKVLSGLHGSYLSGKWSSDIGVNETEIKTSSHNLKFFTFKCKHKTRLDKKNRKALTAVRLKSSKIFDKQRLEDKRKKFKRLHIVGKWCTPPSSLNLTNLFWFWLSNFFYSSYI